MIILALTLHPLIFMQSNAVKVSYMAKIYASSFQHIYYTHHRNAKQLTRRSFRDKGDFWISYLNQALALLFCDYSG